MSLGASRDLQFEAQWRYWLQRQAESGLTIAAFCRQHDLPRSTFYGWRFKLGNRDRQRTAAIPTFVPVKVNASTLPAPAASLEILLDGGHGS